MNKYFRKNVYRHLIENSIKATEFAKRGKEKLKIGAYNNALIDFNRAISIQNDNPYLLYDRALCYNGISDYANAYDDICRAVNLDSKFVEAYVEKGNLEQIFGDNINSILSYSKALELDKDNTEAFFNRGYVNLINERFNEAVNDFSEVIKRRPYDADAYNNLGLAYIHGGKLTKGLAYLHKSCELDPLSDANENLEIITSKMKKSK